MLTPGQATGNAASSGRKGFCIIQKGADHREQTFKHAAPRIVLVQGSCSQTVLFRSLLDVHSIAFSSVIRNSTEDKRAAITC